MFSRNIGELIDMGFVTIPVGKLEVSKIFQYGGGFSSLPNGELIIGNNKVPAIHKHLVFFLNLVI